MIFCMSKAAEESVLLTQYKSLGSKTGSEIYFSIKGIVHPKMTILSLIIPSCHSKPVRPFVLDDPASMPLLKAVVASWIESWTCNPKVASSSLRSGKDCRGGSE